MDNMFITTWMVWGRSAITIKLITAYRADCDPFVCVDNEGVEHGFNKIIDKWICEGFQSISLW